MKLRMVEIKDGQRTTLRTCNITYGYRNCSRENAYHVSPEVQDFMRDYLGRQWGGQNVVIEEEG